MHNSGVLVIGRSLGNLLRNPAPILSGLGMSLFFLIVYNAGIGGIGFLPEFEGAGYLAYLLPMGIISLCFASSAGSAQALSRDITSGYFFRLALAPVPRAAFILGAILADAAGIFISAAAVIATGALLGAPLADGMSGLLSAAALTTLFGAGISAASAAVVMRSGRVELAGTIGMAIFTLMFLSPTFVPLELIESGWLRLVSAINPLTYLMGAMRAMVSGIGDPGTIPVAFAIALTGGIGGILLAVRSVRNVVN